MKLARISNNVKRKRDKSDDENHVNTDLTNLFLMANGNVRFGTGTDGDRGENIAGEFQVFTTSATPDAENTIAHTMKTAPIGYIVLNQDKAGSLYDSGTAWTSSSIYLKSDVASVAFTVFLIK